MVIRVRAREPRGNNVACLNLQVHYEEGFSNVLKAIDSGMSWINRVAGALAGLALALATAAVFTQIVVRFALPRFGITLSLPWTEESARFLMVWFVFLGVAVLCRRGGLIAITTLQTSLPYATARWVILASAVCSAVFFAILLIVGWQWAMSSMRETATVLRIPMGLVYIAMPIGSAIALANLTLFAFDLFRASPDEAQTDQPVAKAMVE